MFMVLVDDVEVVELEPGFITGADTVVRLEEGRLRLNESAASSSSSSCSVSRIYLTELRNV